MFFWKWYNSFFLNYIKPNITFKLDYSLDTHVSLTFVSLDSTLEQFFRFTSPRSYPFLKRERVGVCMYT